MLYTQAAAEYGLYGLWKNSQAQNTRHAVQYWYVEQ